eukprot:jgi/Bigna1/87573/estExt_fgenesh1_pg.C_220012
MRRPPPPFHLLILLAPLALFVLSTKNIGAGLITNSVRSKGLVKMNTALSSARNKLHWRERWGGTTVLPPHSSTAFYGRQVLSPKSMFSIENVQKFISADAWKSEAKMMVDRLLDRDVEKFADGEILQHPTLGEMEVVYLTAPKRGGSRRIGPFLRPTKISSDDSLPHNHREKQINRLLKEKIGFDHEYYIGGSARKAVIALDFDGVLIDSVPESSETAWRTAEKIWPELFTKEINERKADIMDQMREVRPVVETGYENPVLLRVLVEGIATVEDIMQFWSRDILPQCMETWGLNRADLVHTFGLERDDWIEKHTREWLATNKAYYNIRFALQKAIDRHDVYIVTTKQKRFVEKLLQERLFIDFPSENIFDTSRGLAKGEILRRLGEQHPEASRLWFIEDKLTTLLKVSADPKLRNWTLCLADWGYNTEDERQIAWDDDRIKLLDQGNAIVLLGETYTDASYKEPNYARPLKLWERHANDHERLNEIPHAIARMDRGEETEDDVKLLQTTPKRFFKGYTLAEDDSILR